MDHPILTRDGAERLGMESLTDPAPLKSPFVQSVISDMLKVKGTRWALVREPMTEETTSPRHVSVWRVMPTQLQKL